MAPSKRSAALTCVCALLSAALYGQFHRGSRTTQPPAPTRFDYFVLSLSWAPAFCDTSANAANNPAECAPGKKVGFVVHGLWPELNSGASPESCDTGANPKTVSRALVNYILPYMLSPDLIRHEWTTHGACSGLPIATYFGDILQARSAVQIPVQIASLGAPIQETPQQIETQFASSNPLAPPGAFRAICRNRALTEVRACFDKDLKQQACTDSVGNCTESFVTIRPLR